MSVPCEEIRPELEALLGAMAEGQLDAAGKKRLAQILREHPDARQFYLDYCQVHALLRDAHGELQALADPSAARRWKWLGAAAAILVMAGMGVALLRTPAIEASVASVQGAAWVVRGDDRVVLNGSRDVRDGDRLVTGPDARTEIRLRDGTRLALHERTDVQVGARIQLREGTLQCDVAPQSRPLVFQTPHAEATVLGTSFELTAGWKETRLRTASGRVRLAAEGRSVEVGPGQVGIADATGVVRWDAVCDYDFTKLKELPPTFDPKFCVAGILHTPQRKIESGAEYVRLTEKGLLLGPLPGKSGLHGLIDLQWTGELGEDVIVEADMAAGGKWALAIATSGTGFEGYRTFFAAIDDYPTGVAVDTIWPAECVVLARDPRPISHTENHTIRVEKRGSRIRAWVDGQIRIDTEVAQPLSESRRRTISLANYGAEPTIRALRVWKAAP